MEVIVVSLSVAIILLIVLMLLDIINYFEKRVQDKKKKEIETEIIDTIKSIHNIIEKISDKYNEDSD